MISSTRASASHNCLNNRLLLRPHFSHFFVPLFCWRPPWRVRDRFSPVFGNCRIRGDHCCYGFSFRLNGFPQNHPISLERILIHRLIHLSPTPSPRGGLVWPSLSEATEEELTSEYVLCRTLFQCGLFRTLFQDTGVLSPASVLSSNLKMWHLGTTCNPQEYNKTPLAITLSDNSHHPPRFFEFRISYFSYFAWNFPSKGANNAEISFNQKLNRGGS